MLESTNLSVNEVMDNWDVYSKWFDETDMTEYEQAFKDAKNEL
jgi:transcription elongation factor Elf1